MTRIKTMRKFASCLGAGALIAVMASGSALAQSSGNFSATGTSAACVIGAGGVQSSGTPLTSFTANLSTGSGNGTTLDIRPNLVTGLFTETKISTSVPTASADVGIQVCVTVDNSGAGVFPASCVTYDRRFQQISSQLFSQLSECTTTLACGTGLPACPANFTCSVTSGTGVCLNNLCNFDLILSTLSAHSFDFIAPVSSGKPHVIKATWSVIGSGVNPSGSGQAISCVGPGVLTVTQTKVFNNSGALTF